MVYIYYLIHINHFLQLVYVLYYKLTLLEQIYNQIQSFSNS